MTDRCAACANGAVYELREVRGVGDCSWLKINQWPAEGNEKGDQQRVAVVSGSRLQFRADCPTVFGMAGMYSMNDLLNLLAQEGAEEVRLEPGKPPVMV